VGIILPAEGNLVVLESDEAMVGDGDAMGIAAEIAEDMMGATKRGFGIDDPFLAMQGTQESVESFLLL
jgi:hypothetical protein